MVRAYTVGDFPLLPFFQFYYSMPRKNLKKSQIVRFDVNAGQIFAVFFMVVSILGIPISILEFVDNQKSQEVIEGVQGSRVAGVYTNAFYESAKERRIDLSGTNLTILLGGITILLSSSMLGVFIHSYEQKRKELPKL